MMNFMAPFFSFSCKALLLQCIIPRSLKFITSVQCLVRRKMVPVVKGGTSTTPLNIETEVMNFVALDTRSELSSPRCL